MTHRRHAIVVALAVLSSCGPGEPPPYSEPPAGYPHAYAMTDCAPWDGIATSITLSADTVRVDTPLGAEFDPPYLWIAIYESAGDLAGERFELDGVRTGGGSRCESGGACDAAEGGWVRILEVGDDRGLRGDFELRFAGEPPLVGGFDAEWIDRTILCG